jgi:hypothetical protein
MGLLGAPVIVGGSLGVGWTGRLLLRCLMEKSPS